MGEKKSMLSKLKIHEKVLCFYPKHQLNHKSQSTSGKQLLSVFIPCSLVLRFNSTHLTDISFFSFAFREQWVMDYWSDCRPLEAPVNRTLINHFFLL